MIKLQIVSDLHNEFRKNTVKYSPPFIGEDVLILAGDIDMGVKDCKYFAELTKTRHVVYVLGNHEGYRNNLKHILENDIQVLKIKVDQLIEEKGYQHKFYILQNDSVEIDGYRFLGGTLWTDFNNDNYNWVLAKQYMNDYHLIEYGDDVLTPAIVFDEHIKTKQFLERELDDERCKKTIVITHHLPSINSVHALFKKDIRNFYSNYFYFSNLEHLMGKAALWCHGHTHYSFDYELNGTRVYCNPFGYEGHDKNKDFKNELVIVE